MVPERNEQGEVETVLAIARDITELKKPSSRQLSREEKYHSLVENTPDVISRVE